MGYIIGETTYPATWRAIRSVVSNFDVPGGAPTFGNHNSAYPAGAKWLKTTAGNGLLRQLHNIGSPTVKFTVGSYPPDDFFEMQDFSDPYPVDLVGKTVTTSSSSFAIIAGHFDPGGASAGTGGTTPVLTIAGFTNVS
jgi:hypothetical protein